MRIKEEDGNLIIEGVECLNLDLSLDCGQAFRWKKDADGFWYGVAFGTPLYIKQDGSTVIMRDTDLDTYEKVWKNYFDFDRDYVEICDRLKRDSLIAPTVDEYYGIRILNQESFEALFSFVISQQNNIKRIKGIIDRLCTQYGERLSCGLYTFPTAERLSKLSVEDFEALGTGYRARYLERLAKAVACGELDLEAIKTLELEQARKALLDIYGVGIKVANCALLFGFGFYDAFPVDVWMKRVMEYYPNGLPECFDGIGGIAQQYLFHWARENNIG